jgi:hypothetical protein
MKKQLLLIAVIFFSLSCGVVYGLLASRFQLFPFPQMKKLYGKFLKMKDTQNTDTPAGRWTSLQKEEEPGSEELTSLPYLQGSRQADHREGVISYVPERSAAGLNLVVSAHGPEVHLMNMKGELIHTWKAPEEILRLPEVMKGDRYFRKAHLFPNGDLLAIYQAAETIVKLDRNSNVLWMAQIGAHHDLDVDEDGTVHLLTHKTHINPQINPTRPVTEDFITVLTSDGKVLENISLIQAADSSVYYSLLQPVRLKSGYGDILHANSLRIIKQSDVARNGIFSPSNWLVSLLQQHSVVVVSRKDRKIVWSMSGLWAFQHEPIALASGSLIVFDNRGGREGSRIVEVDPVSKNVLWMYEGSKNKPFFTATTGGLQRLENGNTLITETEAGRVFEVTQSKEIVWEWISPFRHKNYVAWVCDVVRIEQDSELWLSGKSSS